MGREDGGRGGGMNRKRRREEYCKGRRGRGMEDRSDCWDGKGLRRRGRTEDRMN